MGRVGGWVDKRVLKCRLEGVHIYKCLRQRRQLVPSIAPLVPHIRTCSPLSRLCPPHLDIKERSRLEVFFIYGITFGLEGVRGVRHYREHLINYIRKVANVMGHIFMYRNMNRNKAEGGGG